MRSPSKSVWTESERGWALHAGVKSSEEAEMRADGEGNPSQGCRGDAKRSAGLKREEGVSYAKCSQEVKSEKFRDIYIWQHRGH